MIFDRELRRSLVALIAFTMPACADTLGPGDATDMPKRWPPGPLRDFLEGLQAPDFPYVDGAPTSCCGVGDVVDTKFKVEPGDEKHRLVRHAQRQVGPHPADKDHPRLRAGREGVPVRAEVL